MPSARGGLHYVEEAVTGQLSSDGVSLNVRFQGRTSFVVHLGAGSFDGVSWRSSPESAHRIDDGRQTVTYDDGSHRTFTGFRGTDG